MFSKIVSKIEPSASLSISNKAKQMKAEGLEVIDLSVGQPDFPLPPNVKETIRKALAEDKVGYTLSRGILELREAIARDIKRKSGLTYSPAEIIVTPGAKQAILTALLTLLNAGDEVIVFEPCWHSYRAMVQMAGGAYLPVAVLKRGDLQKKEQEIIAQITNKTKAVLLNNPVNPTGAVWSLEDLRTIAKIAKQNNLWVIADEIYDEILFDDYKVHCFAGLSAMKERTILINGFSKTYAMPGLRLGYLAGSKEFTDQAAKIHEHSSTCACSLSQYAGLASLSGENKDYVEKNQKEYQKRRDFVFEQLSQVPFKCLEPQGAFYIFFGLRETKMNSSALAEFFLEKAGVALIPGTAFGKAGEGYLRMSFAVDLKTLKTALVKIKSTI